jgi:hypothetical protein
MTNSMNIVSAEKSANGGRVLADANLGFGQKFQCKEIRPGYLEMNLAVSVTSDALLILSDSVSKAIKELLQNGVEGVREKFLAQKQDNLIRALEMLKAAIVSEDKGSIFKAAIQMEESREMAASYSGFLDNMLNVECSQAMANALIKLRG